MQMYIFFLNPPNSNIYYFMNNGNITENFHSLQQWRQQTQQRFYKPVHIRTVMQLTGFAEIDATILIAHVNVLYAQRRLAIVEEHVGLEVVLKTTEVDVCRAACGYLIVGNKQLAMVESLLIQPHLYACLQRFGDVRHACQLYEPGCGAV